MGSRKESCFDSGKRAATEIVNLIPIRACVDEHVQVKANVVWKIENFPLKFHFIATGSVDNFHGASEREKSSQNGTINVTHKDCYLHS